MKESRDLEQAQERDPIGLLKLIWERVSLTREARNPDCCSIDIYFGPKLAQPHECANCHEMENCWLSKTCDITTISRMGVPPMPTSE